MNFISLWLIDLLTSIQSLCIIFCIVILALGLILIFYALENSRMFNDETNYVEELIIFNNLKKALIICSIIFGIFCILPSRETAMIMFVVDYSKKNVQKVVTPERLEKINKIIDNRLDKLLDE